MESKYKFLNYKKYENFLRDLENWQNNQAESAIENDSIVFIQDKSRIWARGKEYRCNGPEDKIFDGDTISFIDENGHNSLTISQSDGTLTFTDADGNTNTATYTLKSNFDQFRSEINNALENHIQDAEEKREALEGELHDSVDTLTTAINTEKTRAEGKEALIENWLRDETNRAMGEESLIRLNLENEVVRASAKEGEIASDLNDEIERATTKEGELQDAIDAEESRATSSETTIQSSLDTEVARAKNRENEIEQNLNVEAIRAAERENLIELNLNNEVSRATGRENAIELNLNNEVARAGGKENAIEASLNEEILNRKTEAIHSVEYVDSSTEEQKSSRIDFKNKSGEVIATIDSTDFIIDGMVDSVELVDNEGNKALKIVFNTDSGKDTILLDVGDLFEIDDYYTKTDINTKETQLQNSIETEFTRATTAEAELSSTLSSAIADIQTQINQISNDLNNYATNERLNRLLQTLETTFVSLQTLVDQNYVLKQDIYEGTEKEWTTSDIQAQDVFDSSSLLQ